MLLSSFTVLAFFCIVIVVYYEDAWLYCCLCAVLTEAYYVFRQCIYSLRKKKNKFWCVRHCLPCLNIAKSIFILLSPYRQFFQWYTSICNMEALLFLNSVIKLEVLGLACLAWNSYCSWRILVADVYVIISWFVEKAWKVCNIKVWYWS